MLDSLQAKLGLKTVAHFSLVVEHVKSLKRNKLTLLNPRDTLAKVMFGWSPRFLHEVKVIVQARPFESVTLLRLTSIPVINAPLPRPRSEFFTSAALDEALRNGVSKLVQFPKVSLKWPATPFPCTTVLTETDTFCSRDEVSTITSGKFPAVRAD